MAKYTGPKRLDGHLIRSSGVHGEHRVYKDEDGIIQVWQFLPGDERGEMKVGMGPELWNALKTWVQDGEPQP